MRRVNSYLLIIIALWLPVQAAAAWAMPFCRHALEQIDQAELVQSAVHCHEQQADADVGRTTPAPDCDNCEMCHLASAGYIPPTATNLPLFAANVFVPRLAQASQSFIPAPPQDPPRRLN